MTDTCFYHKNACSNNVALYRVKYVLGYAPELVDKERELCKECYRFLTRPFDILRELSELSTIRTRYPRLIYIEPMKRPSGIVVVMKAPDQDELEVEIRRDKKFNETTAF